MWPGNTSCIYQELPQALIGYGAFKKHPIGCFGGDWVVKDFGNWLGVIETIEIIVNEGCHACNAWMLHLMG